MSNATQSEAEKEVFGNFVRNMTEQLGGTYAASVVVSAVENVRAQGKMAFHPAHFAQGEEPRFFCGHCGKVTPLKEHPDVWSKMLCKVQDWLKKEGLFEKAGGYDGSSQTFNRLREIIRNKKRLLGKTYIYCDGCKLTPEQQEAINRRMAEMQEAAERIAAQNKKMVAQIEAAKKAEFEEKKPGEAKKNETV